MSALAVSTVWKSGRKHELIRPASCFERESSSLQPQNLRFGGGVTETILNPFVLVVVLIIGVLVLVLPRARAIPPLVAASLLIPMDQVLLIGGMHFPMLRVVALFGFARLLRDKISSRSPVFTGGINNIDIAVISFALVTAIAGVLLFQVMGALVFQLGFIYTIFGIYFLLRHLIRDEADILRMLRTLAWVAAVVAGIMTWEVTTGRNPYAVLGGASAEYYATAMSRADRFRATGCFAHPILAGTFGAIITPLFVLLWQQSRKNRILAYLGILSATVITLASNSSTPVVAYAAGLLALCMWPLRNYMRPIRWGLVVTVVSLHLVMKAPVWHLIARIDISGGSSSYHRFMLVDECIRHFSDWWLIGVKSTFEWGWDMWDTANQYVALCDSSGLLSFILFLAIIVYAFKYLGKARRTANRQQQVLLWCLGAGLVSNVVAFMGISYTDQITVVWYGLLACISTAAMVHLKTHSIHAAADAHSHSSLAHQPGFAILENAEAIQEASVASSHRRLSVI